MQDGGDIPRDRNETAVNFQGPRSKFSSRGAEEECVKDFCFGQGGGGGHACGFLFNFSKVTDKTIDFFPHPQ